MTAKQGASQAPQANESSQPAIRRKRRHWYDHEKIEIVNKFDNHELPRVPGKPNCVTDPKSKEILSVFLIEGWRDQFRGMGLIKKERDKVEKEAKKENVSIAQTRAGSATEIKLAENDKDAMQSLLLDTLIENKKLKAQLESLRRGGARRNAESSL